MAGAGRRIGIYGFGAAAHIITHVAFQHGQAYAFVARDDDQAIRFARDMGDLGWVLESAATLSARLRRRIVGIDLITEEHRQLRPLLDRLIQHPQGVDVQRVDAAAT